VLLVAAIALPVGPAEAAGTDGVTGPAPRTAATLVAGSRYHALTPVRILESATGAGGATRLRSGKPAPFQIAGSFGVPAGATAVAGTLSISGASHAGYVALTPVSCTPTTISTSTISLPAGGSGTAGVTATLGDDGKLWALYVTGGGGGTAQLAFDLDGYYAPDVSGATYHAAGPVRVFDSRLGLGGATPLAAGVPEPFQLAGASGIPVGATAVTGTLTIAGASGPGRVAVVPALTTGSAPVAAPTTVTLAPTTIAAQSTGVTATLGSDGKFWIVYETGRAGSTAQVIFDLTGYFTPDGTGSTFHRLGPLRLFDSRTGVGNTDRLASEVPQPLQVAGHWGIPAGTTALTGTVTVADATRRGYVALTPSAVVPVRVTTSSLNVAQGEARAGGVTIPVGWDGDIWAIFKTGSTGGTADLIFDLSGYFAPEPAGLTPPAAYFETFASFDRSPRDLNGVFMVDYGAGIGLQYNAVHIAQGAIKFFDRWQSGADTPAQEEVDRTTFEAQVEWLVGNQLPDGRWLYDFKWGRQEVPWWSALSEGLAISALLRAYSVSGDDSYLQAMVRARSTFDRAISDHGVCADIIVKGRHLSVYEEYLPGYANNVLNGWVYSLAGLYEYAIYTGDPIALYDLTAADRGLAAIRTLLPYYDSGSGSFYGLSTLVGPKRGSKASSFYHNLHIRQLRFLGSISGDPVFTRYANRFQSYLPKPVD
jgi:hypothetical protein